MNDQRPEPSSDDYVLLPSVTHPGGRAKAFDDAFKAMVRAMIEVNDNPTLAYAIDKTDRILTEETMDSLPEAEVAEWHEACDEFESMSEEAQEAWIEKVLTEYPKIAELPDLDGYNHMN